MTSTTSNWKELVHEGIVKHMRENAKFKNGVPDIAAITRAGIYADLSGEYNGLFTNEFIQEQVKLIHSNGTPITCIRWYRSNLGPRKTTARAGFQEAYAMFKEQGKTISQEDLAKIAEANLHVIFGARGADLEVLSQYHIMEDFKTAMEAKKQEAINAKLEKARAARVAKEEKAAAKEAAKEAQATVDETVQKVAKLKKKK